MPFDDDDGEAPTDKFALPNSDKPATETSGEDGEGRTIADRPIDDSEGQTIAKPPTNATNDNGKPHDKPHDDLEQRLETAPTGLFNPDDARTNVVQARAAPRPNTPSAKTSDAAAYVPGQVILNGEYRILGVLGEGGMGRVYRAMNLFLNREVALKVLLNEGEEEARRIIGAIGEEGEAMARVRNPQPKMVDIYMAKPPKGDQPGFIEQELVNGETFQKILKTQRFTAVETLRYLEQMCIALRPVHDAGLVHRDLKPENMMRTPENIIKIIDLGVAAKRGEVPDTTAGSMPYMAPEQLRFGVVDAFTDTYAMALTAYELFTGKRLRTKPEIESIARYLKTGGREQFSLRERDLEDLVKEFETAPLPTGQTFWQRADEKSARKALQKIVAKGSKIDEQQRYQSVNELRTLIINRSKRLNTMRLAVENGIRIGLPSLLTTSLAIWFGANTFNTVKYRNPSRVESARTQYERGLTLQSVEDVFGAEGQLEGALAKLGELSWPKLGLAKEAARLEALANLRLGDGKIKIGHYDDAKELYRVVANRQPLLTIEEKKYLNARFRQLEKPEEAIPLFQTLYSETGNALYANNAATISWTKSLGESGESRKGWRQKGLDIINEAIEPITDRREEGFSIKREDPGNLALLLLKRGWFQREMGASKEALASYEEARRIALDQPNRLLLGNVHASIGVMEYHRGRLPEAQASLELAVKILQEEGGVGSLAKTYETLASVLSESGNKQAAMAKITNAVKMYEEMKNTASLPDALYNAADIHSEAGAYADAVRFAQEGVTIAKTQGNSYLEAILHLPWGDSFAYQGEHARAKEQYLLTIDSLRENAKDTFRVYALGRLGETEFELGDDAAARSAIDEAVKEGEDNGYLRPFLLTLEAKLLEKDGKTRRALQLLEESYDAATTNGLPKYQALALLSKGELLMKQGEIALAHNVLEEAYVRARESGVEAYAKKAGNLLEQLEPK